VIWTKTEQTGITTIVYTGNVMLESYGGRYSVGVSGQKECTLRINNLQLSDAGTITCIDAVPGHSPQLKRAATVTVIGMYCYFINYYESAFIISKTHKNLGVKVTLLISR